MPSAFRLQLHLAAVNVHVNTCVKIVEGIKADFSQIGSNWFSMEKRAFDKLGSIQSRGTKHGIIHIF